MDDKAAAVALVVSFVTDLGDAYAPYFEETAQLLLPLLGYDMNDDVKEHAMECLPDLVKGGVEAMKNGKLDKKTVAGYVMFIYNHKLDLISFYAAIYSVFMAIVEALVNRLVPPMGPTENPSPASLVLGQVLLNGGDLTNDVLSDGAIVSLTQRIIAMLGVAVRQNQELKRARTLLRSYPSTTCIPMFICV